MFPQRPSNVKFGKPSSSGVKPEGLYDARITKVVYEGSLFVSIDAIVDSPSQTLSIGIDGLVGSALETGLRPRIYAHIPRLVAGFEFGPLDFVGTVPNVGDRGFVGFKEGSTDNLVLLTKGSTSGGSTVSTELNLGDLLDVDLTGLQDGNVIVYDSGTMTWVPGTASGTTTGGDANIDDILMLMGG